MRKSPREEEREVVHILNILVMYTMKPCIVIRVSNQFFFFSLKKSWVVYEMYSFSLCVRVLYCGCSIYYYAWTVCVVSGS